MKSIFKKNQIIIAALAVMICIAGYLNFTKEDTIEEASSLGTTDDIYDYEALTALTDYADEASSNVVELPDDSFELSANGEIVNASGAAAETSLNTSDDESEEAVAGEAILASTIINHNYFSEAKLSREQIRAKNKETLMSIVENDEVSEGQKQEALAAVIKMTETAELENATELLLGAKGFDGVVVSIVEDSIDVVVNTASITDAQVAQIEDIVTRKTGFSPDAIVISPVVAED